jgi:hypothetical protein
MAIAGLVLGLVGVVLAFIPCIGWIGGIICGILGLVFAAIGMGQAGKVGAPKGMATAGLVLSLVAIIWGPVWNWYFVLPAAAREGERKAKEVLDELNKKQR